MSLSIGKNVYLGKATPGTGGGSAPVINALNVTPTTSAQTITAPSGTDGYSPVNVSAVTSSIDANITTENIKSGVDILGVIGTYTGSAPAHYIERAVDANGKLVNNVSNFIDLTGVTDIGPYALCSAFRGNTNLTGTIDMSGITTISGNNACDSMFYSCSNITKIDCSGIETITGQGAFSYCFAQNTNMIEADFSGLKYITGTNAFSNTFFMCEKMTTFKCDNLESINIGTNNCATGSLFAYDRRLVSLSFPKLSVINGILGISYAQLAADCERLESVSFGGVKASTFANQTNQLQYLFNNRTGVSAPNGCTVHFPSNFDPSDPNHTFDASTLTGYPTFNGSASYIHVAFDLPATE